MTTAGGMSFDFQLGNLDTTCYAVQPPKTGKLKIFLEIKMTRDKPKGIKITYHPATQR